ncbi:uncharacterized protein VTP21DRAFT_7051 [Calcarisporiella thermophila]|uniref:uncharacterized protein n=1 Tax=Calcarisporiella thermophila TaxID=911321 RepID=UPI0037428730
MLFKTVFLLAACISASLAQTAEVESELAPLVVPKTRVLNGNYIVVYKDDASFAENEIQDQAIKAGVKHVYNLNAFKGYSGKFDAETLKKIRRDPKVKFVELDAEVSINDVQSGAPWGLARISHRAKLDANTKDKYIYDANSGNGVTAYVIDTGVYIQHPEFQGRARWGATFASDGNTDGHGHGTHVAGTIASKTYGVAKKASIVAVKVLNAQGSGTNSDVIAGINWAANDSKKNKKHTSVANMSLGGGASTAVDNAVNSAVDAGLSIVVAAGNNNGDACNNSPARASKAVTVAASDVNDKKASFSNYGRCVHIIGPGVNVLSTWKNGGTNTISGTSMASPHIAGLAAHFLSQQPRDPIALRTFLQQVATKDAISGFPAGTPNLLGYNNNGAAAAA